MGFSPCGKCTKGWILKEDSAVKCECLSSYQKSLRLEIALKKANIETHTTSIKSLKLKNESLLLKLRYYVDNLLTKKSCHLYLLGKNDTSKTFSAKSILYSACEKGVDCLFISMGDLVNLISDSFIEEEKVKPYYTTPLLVIDDAFDKDKVTIYKSGFQISFIDRLLRKRLETNKLNTIFTSNIPVAEIEKNGFSKDIQNLIEREVEKKKGVLFFDDVFVPEELDIKIESIWD